MIFIFLFHVCCVYCVIYTTVNPLTGCATDKCFSVEKKSHECVRVTALRRGAYDLLSIVNVFLDVL